MYADSEGIKQDWITALAANGVKSSCRRNSSSVSDALRRSGRSDGSEKSTEYASQVMVEVETSCPWMLATHKIPNNEHNRIRSFPL